MNLTEQNHMYRLAYYFVAEQQYEMLHMNKKTNEVWIEKEEKKSTNIIRLFHQEFDWKNHMKADMTKVFRKVKSMKNLFNGKKINIYNVYVAENEPVDDWQAFKKTLILKERRPIKMNVFYLSKEHYSSEVNRLFSTIHLPPLREMTSTIDKEETSADSYYKKILFNQLQQKVDDVKKVVTYGKTRMTYLFLIIHFIYFITLEMYGGSTNTDVLAKFGAIYNHGILNAEWWHLLSAMFLHVGPFHLIINMVVLYYLGIVTERVYGSIRFTIIYLLSGIGGTVVSLMFNSNITVGASGALFGLFGALLYFGYHYQRLLKQTIGKNMIMLLLINIAISIIIPHVDLSAHLGGLLGGIMAAMIVHVPYKRNLYIQGISALFYILYIGSIIYYFIQ